MEKSVLVVEDDDAVRGMIAQFLEENGYLVYEAADGPEALEIVEKEKPSLVILDLRLIRMQGMQVLKSAKQIAPEVVVVILTGSYEEERAKEAIRSGAYDYVTKPISLKKFKEDILDRIFP